MSKAILLISCPDTKGIVARVSDFLYKNNGNIEDADQHSDAQTNTFFMRISWSLDGFKIPRCNIAKRFSSIARHFKMSFSVHFSDDVPRVAIFVSRATHCLYDLLLRYKEGQFRCHVSGIIGNHANAAPIARSFDIPFFEFSVRGNNRRQVEKCQSSVLNEQGVQLVVFARYMQVVSPSFVRKFSERIINIHHSFLPAFAGSDPYRQAYTRGVKIIGATSHYVTNDLDAGPIIEQDTVCVSHRDSISDMQRKGQDLEKVVLARAVRLHLERKILVYNNKTVVFE
ncbi:MAG: formyltetrahydrofolate deformylase [Candidatus Omnitrophota bacterium]|nr:formyltetrahydrofolate deformylase [Candidatus Omnitrophota bacterium]